MLQKDSLRFSRHKKAFGVDFLGVREIILEENHGGKTEGESQDTQKSTEYVNSFTFRRTKYVRRGRGGMTMKKAYKNNSDGNIEENRQ